jgi:hypothetical protein
MSIVYIRLFNSLAWFRRSSSGTTQKRLVLSEFQRFVAGSCWLLSRQMNMWLRFYEAAGCFSRASGQLDFIGLSSLGSLRVNGSGYLNTVNWHSPLTTHHFSTWSEQMSPSDVPDPISPNSASAGLPSEPAYSTLSACLNGPLNRKTMSSSTVISLADLRSPSSDLPPTPKTPDFGVENQTSHRADGPYVLPVHPLSDHTKNDVNRRKEQNRFVQAHHR